MIQIIISGTAADYDSRRAVSYKIVTGWLSTDNLFSAAMYNIALPRTMLNMRLLNYPDNPSAASADNIPCTVICAGAQIIDGTLRVSKVSRDSIQVIITDRLSDLYANIRDMTFESSTRELPLHAVHDANDWWAPTKGQIQDELRIYYPMIYAPSFYQGIDSIAFPPGVWGTEEADLEAWHNMPDSLSPEAPMSGTSGYVNASQNATDYSIASMYRRSPFVPALMLSDLVGYACETAGWTFDAATFPAAFARLSAVTGYEAGGIVGIGFEGGDAVMVRRRDTDNTLFTIKLADWGRTVKLSDLLIGICQLANLGIVADSDSRIIRFVDKESAITSDFSLDLSGYAVSHAEVEPTGYDAFVFQYQFGGDSYNELIAKIDADPSLLVSDGYSLPAPTYRIINKYAFDQGSGGLYQCVKFAGWVDPSWDWRGLADLIAYRTAQLSNEPFAVQCLLHPFYYPGPGAVPYADMPAYRSDFADIPAQPIRIGFIAECNDGLPRFSPSHGAISLKPADIAGIRYPLLSRLATDGKVFSQSFEMPAHVVRHIADNKYSVYSCAGKAFVIDELTAEFTGQPTALVKLTGIYL